MGRLTCAPADAGHLVTVHPVLGGGSQRRGRLEASLWPRAWVLSMTLKGSHGFAVESTPLSRQAAPSEGGGRCRAQLYGVATCRSQQRGRPLSGTALRCRDMPFPAKGAAAVGHQGLGARFAQTGV